MLDAFQIRVRFRKAGRLLVASAGFIFAAALVTPAPAAAETEFRAIDGTGNNLSNSAWGSAGDQLLRTTTVDYGDGVWTPAGADRPSAREISNLVCAQGSLLPISVPVTSFVWQWGQFLDHDIDLTAGGAPAEPFDIPVPLGDPYFDPFGTGTQVIAVDRSVYDPATGTASGNPRQQMNLITAYIDASNVYGSDSVRAAALRTNDGTGRLKTSAGDLLPFNTGGLPNAGGTSPSLFLAGDVRANEQVGLTALHTLFVREHNRVAARIHHHEPELSDDEIYERARRIVSAEMQVITYKEFLPYLLGPGALAPYTGYDPDVDPGIGNIFSTASYRFGHSMLPDELLRLDQKGVDIPQGNLPLRNAFFAPGVIVNEGGIDPLLRGLAAQRPQEVDAMLVDDIRNFLFGPPGSGGFDLASLNLQRGRDHGLPGYNQTRADMGLAPAATFADITSDPALQAALQQAYGTVDQVEAWVGGLSEDHLPGALVGELVFTVLREQFERLRDGDRFWYENSFSKSEISRLEKTRLSDIIRRNTGIGGEIQKDVFVLRGQHLHHHDHGH
ncbi:MAG: peroxidase family protein [Deltaproteobacteria bacterium]|nr:peroxidase family protein [Deltaproteobacteria bacterium]